MIRPIKIKIVDFLSHGESEYVFKKQDVDSIIGINYDSEQNGIPGSNGSGKSVLIEALTFALTGDILRDSNLSDTIRDGCSEAYVTIEMVDDISADTYEIRRIIYANSRPTKATLFVNQKELSISSVNDFVIEKCGIQKKDLLTFFVVSKDSPSFITATDGDKKRLLSRLCDTSVVDNAFQLIKNETSQLDVEISQISNKINRNLGSISTLNSQIQSQNIHEWEENKKQRILKAEQELIQLEDTKKSTTSDGSVVKKQLAEIQEQYQKVSSQSIDTSTLQQLKTTKDQLNREKAEFSILKTKSKSTVSASEALKHSALTCPKCSHEFAPTGVSVEDLNNTIHEHTCAIINAEKAMNELDVKISENAQLVIKEETAIEEKKKEMYKLRDDVSSLTIKLNSLRSKYQELESNINAKKLQLTTLQEEKHVFDPTSLEQHIALLSKENEELQAQLEELSTQKQTILQGNEVFKNFNTFLISNALSVIEKRTNHFIQAMNESNMTVKLEMVSTKTSIDKIQMTILQNGQEKKYGRFSSGERAKINIANIVACQSLINERSPNEGLDVLFLDEVIESVDALGVENLLRSMKDIRKTIVVITHATHYYKDTELTRVVKRGGVSKIQQGN